MTDKIIGFLNWVEQYRPEPLGDDMALSIYDVDCITTDDETITGYWCATHLKDASEEFLRNRYGWFVMAAIARFVFDNEAFQFFTEDGIQLKPIAQVKDFKVRYQRTLTDSEKRE